MYKDGFSIIRVGTNKQTFLRVEINMLNYFKIHFFILRFVVIDKFNQWAFYFQMHFVIFAVHFIWHLKWVSLKKIMKWNKLRTECDNQLDEAVERRGCK